MKSVLGLNVPSKSTQTPCTEDFSLIFRVSSFTLDLFPHRNWKRECERSFEVQGMCAYQQGPYPQSTVIWVGSACDLLVYGMVSQTVDPGLLEGRQLH
jgi:hypothetical protein